MGEDRCEKGIWDAGWMKGREDLEPALLLLAWNELSYDERVLVLKRGLPARAIFDAQKKIAPEVERTKDRLFDGVRAERPPGPEEA